MCLTRLPSPGRGSLVAGPRDFQIAAKQFGVFTRTHAKNVDAIRVTASNRALVDCAAELTADGLEAALDTALFRGFTSVPALERYICERRLGHLRGVGRLRQMLADRIKGTSHSELERIFFRKLRKSKLPTPIRQFRVGSKFIDI